MTTKKFYFDCYIDGNVTKNFFVDRVLVKNVSTLKKGPPMFFFEKHCQIKEHPLISQYIRSQKLKFTKFRKVEVAFSVAEAASYFDTSSQSLHLKSEPLLQANPVVAASSSTSSSSSKSVAPRSAPTTPRTMSTRRTSVQSNATSKRVKFVVFLGRRWIKSVHEHPNASQSRRLGRVLSNVHRPLSWHNLRSNFCLPDRTLSWSLLVCKTKCEVLKNYLKSIPDADLIQLVSWSLPKECQKSVMPMIHTKLSVFLDAFKSMKKILTKNRRNWRLFKKKNRMQAIRTFSV